MIELLGKCTAWCLLVGAASSHFMFGWGPHFGGQALRYKGSKTLFSLKHSGPWGQLAVSRVGILFEVTRRRDGKLVWERMFF